MRASEPRRTDNALPFLRWAGSKRKLVPKLASYWSADCRRYVEPFTGSAVLFFHLAPKDAYLSDINEELVNCLISVAQRPHAVYDACLDLPANRRTYDALRRLSPHGMPKTDRAIRFLYLNRNCFNGIYRTNASGDFNVPFSGQRVGTLPPRESFLKAASLLRTAKISCQDFESAALTAARQGSFVYLDPPYATSTRRVFREYDAQAFATVDLDRLSRLLHTLDQRHARFLLSYAYCREAVQCFGTWRTTKHYTFRNVAGFASRRRRAAELLVTNVLQPAT